MITHKSRIAKLPFSIKFSFRKKDWYLLPQGWTHSKSVCEMHYDSERSKKINDGFVYQHSAFWLVTRYDFAWLFFNMAITLDESRRISNSHVIEKHYDYTLDHPVKEIFYHGRP